MKKTRGGRQPRVLAFIVFAYLGIAIIWWAILLLRKNQEVFAANTVVAEQQYLAEHKNRAGFETSSAYLELLAKAQRQRWMIYGETAMFLLALFVGLHLINRGYSRELEATRQKRNFLLAITHELKSPLASIKLILQSLKRTGFTPEQQLQMMEDGGQEVDRLNSLVNNILLAARLDKSYHPQFEKCALDEIIDPVIHSLHTRYPDREMIVSGNTEVAGRLDRDGLTSVLYNLLDNALKYDPAGGSVRLKIAIDADDLEMSISDLGPGISHLEKNRIFDQFYRAGSEDQRKTKGTGLGLYLVKKIVEWHGGKISVSDNSPQGTIFTVKLKMQ